MNTQATTASANHTPLVDTKLLPEGGDGDVRAAHRIYEHLVGIWAPGVVEAAQDLGAFAVLAEGPATAAQLAERLDTDLRATRVLLDGLHAYDILGRARGEDGQPLYSLPPEMHGVFAPGGLYSLAGKITHDRKVAWDAWRNLAANVRSGAQEINRISEEDYTALVHGINFWAPPITQVLAKGLRAHGWTSGAGRRMIDVGCGTGIYSQLLLNEFPELLARGLDVERIVPIADGQAERLGVSDRFRTEICDFWNDDWGNDSSLALFVNIFHLQTPESAHELLLKTSKSLAEDGVIAIADHIVDEGEEGSTQNKFSRLFAASMLATGGGDAFTVQDYDKWLADAGLRRIALLDAPMHRVLLAGHA